MARCLLLHPNRSDAPVGAKPGAVLSGGSWVLPLSNLQDRRLSRVARSTNLAAASTRFDVTMTAQKEIVALVLINHNLTVAGQLKVTAWYDDQSYASPAFQVMQDVYPSLAFTEDLAWESDNWWDGKPLGEELEGFTQNAVVILPAAVSAPNWRVEITDPANPAGYVEAGRLFMAGGWAPSFNYSYGGAHRYETNTAVEQSLSGVEYFDRREPYRVATIAFEYLPQQEALEKGLELCRRAGVDGEVFWIADPADARNITRLSFLGRLRQLQPWEQVVFERANIAFEIKELL